MITRCQLTLRASIISGEELAKSDVEERESGRLARRQQKAGEMHCGCRSSTPVLPRRSKALKIGGVHHHCSAARVTWSFLQPTSGLAYFSCSKVSDIIDD